MSTFMSGLRGKLLGFGGGLLLLMAAGVSRANSVTYVYTDPQGTPLAEADVNGNITATFDYAPYGSIALGTAPNGPGYTGHVNDPDTPDTQLVYMQARYYDPGAGRFLSVDPVMPAAGNGFNFNRYTYAGNNPVVHIDPDGREPIPPGEIAAEAEEAAAAAQADAQAAGASAEAGAAAQVIWVDPANPSTRPPTVQANKAAGDAFENQVASDFRSTGKAVVQQITIKTDSGVKTRLDIVTIDSDGKFQCVECKSSETARLTKNQKKAFQEIERTGGTVVGKGKPGVPGGTRMPPRPVEIKRPPPSPTKGKPYLGPLDTSTD